jgi:ATP-dependent Lon protease
VIASVLRKIAIEIVRDDIKSVKVTPKDIEKYLGKKLYRHDMLGKQGKVGVVNGLAWTSVGGITLSIETVSIPGNGTISLTGQLGDVMKESAGAGMSYLRSISNFLQINPEFYKTQDIHIHIPEGATPKDGPSAGVSMFISMVSAISGIPVAGNLAMTGEITLGGNILPVGGIREKLLAAHRAGIKKILLPIDNEKDLEEIPKKVADAMEFVLITHASEALKHALGIDIKQKKLRNKK